LSHYFIGLAIFIPIWWCWAGHTYFANRFERNDTFQVITVLVQLFAVTVLITSINPLFDGHPQQFILGYFVIRLLLVMMYVREWKINQENNNILRNLAVGFGLGAIVWLSSLLFDATAMYAILVLSILLEIIVLALNSKSLKADAKTHAEHLAERTGLFTIIMLGEVVVALLVFLENTALNMESLVLSGTGFTILALMWWLYFRVSGPLIEDNPILDSQVHGYSNLFIFLSIIIISTAISSWGVKDQNVIIWLTASALTLFVTTLQIILGQSPLYAGRLGLNICRYISCFVPLVLAAIFYRFGMNVLIFNSLLTLWLCSINYSHNFTKFITRDE